jgi:hypothetical protein
MKQAEVNIKTNIMSTKYWHDAIDRHDKKYAHSLTNFLWLREHGEGRTQLKKRLYFEN